MCIITKFFGCKEFRCTLWYVRVISGHRKAFLQRTALLLFLFSSPAQALAEDSSLGQPSAKETQRIATPHRKAVGQLQRQVRTIWSGATLRLGTTSIYVVDADTGEELYNVHAGHRLNPASNTKLVSTATVLATLGPDWRFQTKAVGPAANKDGIVAGSIYLEGDYDPTLGPSALSELAKNLSQKGIKEIHGDIVLDNTGYRDTLAHSRIKVTVIGTAPGKRPLVELWPATSIAKVEAVSARSRRRGRSNVRVQSSLQSDENGTDSLSLSIRGSIRSGHKRVFYINVPNRSQFTASVFRQALKDVGIEVLGTIRYESSDAFLSQSEAKNITNTTLAIHQSAAMSALISRVNKRSLNYMADRLVMSAARSRHHGELSMESAVVLMKEWLTSIGIDADSVVIDTGSGLSYKTLITTKQIVTILRAAGEYGDSHYSASAAAFRDSLSIGGVDGTLRSRFKQKGVSLNGRVRGKTGTLRSVIALSGFLTRNDGRTLCFSIVTNGHRNEQKRSVRLAHEHIVTKLDSFMGKPGAPLSPQQQIHELLSDGKPATVASQLLAP